VSTGKSEESRRLHLSVDEARALSERALAGMGFEPEEARIVADHVIDAALCGYEYSGLAKLLNVGDSPRFEVPRTPMSIVRETSVSALFDGGNNNGMLSMFYATQAAIERAQAHGFALIGLTNTWTSGRGAYYVEMIARAGLIGIHTVSASRRVAPMGGTKAVLGTNPIAFGFPTDGDPLVIDIGTSAFMATDLKMRERLGTALPEGVAIDADGRPTTDPGLARLGAILPFGGHKGYALAVAIRALGVLCEPALDLEKINGYVTIAFKPDLLVPLDVFRSELSAAIAEIKATPRQEGVNEIRIPGERSYAERRQRLRDGIEIDSRIRDALEAWAQGHGKS
jgi:LDH2 family malate/lactate/ureidoglycolate dehydrogenase